MHTAKHRLHLLTVENFCHIDSSSKCGQKTEKDSVEPVNCFGKQ